MSGTIPFFTLWSLNPIDPGYGRDCTIYLLLSQRINTTFWRLLTPSSSYCHLICAITLFSKTHFIILLGKLLQDAETLLRPVDYMIIGPLSHFSGCEVSSFVRSNTVWTIRMVDTALLEFADNGLAEGLHEGNRKTKHCPFSWEEAVQCG